MLYHWSVLATLLLSSYMQERKNSVICMDAPRARIFNRLDASYPIVFDHASRLQNGLCYHCRKAIVKGQDDIAVREAQPPKYYHAECAKKLHII